MTLAITLVLLALVAGSLVFSLLAIEAARRYLALKAPPLAATPPISILKPLAGAEEDLEENLRTFFEQEYPRFEILMAVSAAEDAAYPVAQRLQRAYPNVPVKIIVSGEPPYPNRKVRSVHAMVEAAQHELLVMSDSDIRVGRDFLRTIAAEFQDADLALATCPYRAVPGGSFWSRLEAVMMNTEFLSGILVARLIEGMRFAVGPTMVCRRAVIDAIGGFEALKNYLAEDFVLGQRAAALGFGVGLSRYVIEHHIGRSDFRANMAHRLRWVRSTRRSRPAGYLGQVFTYPLPLTLLLVAWAPAWWPLLAAAAVLRLINSWQVGWRILHDPLLTSRTWLVPVQDMVSFLYWIAGFAGNTILWRGKQYLLHSDGTFAPLRE
ncbi:MAG: bacteriohopanetetrol glucosamine biosynthesis glycosyltransferase HpnI [Acidobacteria bacterium]|nr:bacteriohopanetetrol glucosamine biosynthesis glycosyltransferase HpnI [Acidobacteriota bacterium]